MRPVLVALLLAGCTARTSAPTVTPIFSNEERAQLEKDVLADVAGNATKVCKRAVLHGTPLPGPADEDILAVIAPRPDQPVSACLAGLAAEGKARPPHTELKPSDALLERCAALPAAVARAVAHEDACSPFLAGRRGSTDPDTMLREVFMMRRLIERALQHGDTMGAAQMWIDFLRLLTDVYRGQGAPIIWSMVAGGAMHQLFTLDQRWFVDLRTLTPAQLADVTQQLDGLEKDAPPLSDVLSESTRILQFWLRNAKGKAWIPPGGADLDADQAQPPPPSPFGEPRDSIYAGLFVQREAGKRFVAGCANVTNGVAALEALTRVANDLAQHPPAGSPARKQLLDPLFAEMPNIWPKYASRFWLGRFYLRALRLHAWVVAHRDGGKCPSVETISKGGGTAALDPVNDRPWTLEPKGETIVVHPSGENRATDFEDYRKLSYVIACGR